MNSNHMSKHPLDRREFLGILGGAIAASAAEGPDIDLIVYNARVYTVDARTPKAEAFAIKNGNFVAVGKTSEIRSLAGKGTQAFDARQMSIVPGFIDCHNHAPGNTLMYDVLVGNPFEVEFVTINSIVDKLKARAQQMPPGTWVEGYFFDDTKVKDKGVLDIRDLDQVSSEHPVAVRHRGGHTSYCNSKALALAGVTRNTPTRPRGRSFATPMANSTAG
jgi:predicted amidohydrolase YtcJ